MNSNTYGSKKKVTISPTTINFTNRKKEGNIRIANHHEFPIKFQIKSTDAVIFKIDKPLGIVPPKMVLKLVVRLDLDFEKEQSQVKRNETFKVLIQNKEMNISGKKHIDVTIEHEPLKSILKTTSKDEIDFHEPTNTHETNVIKNTKENGKEVRFHEEVDVHDISSPKRNTTKKKLKTHTKSGKKKRRTSSFNWIVTIFTYVPFIFGVIVVLLINNSTSFELKSLKNTFGAFLVGWACSYLSGLINEKRRTHIRKQIQSLK